MRLNELSYAGDVLLESVGREGRVKEKSVGSRDPVQVWEKKDERQGKTGL